jgi:hypothetical protein
MLDYIEKRDYIRMTVDCAARINLEGIEPLSAIVKDLSANGVLLWVDTKIPSGSIGTVSILPGKNITPPLSAEIEVIRCEPSEEDPATFAAACTIKEIQKVNAA